jgi:hypothetical protein
MGATDVGHPWGLEVPHQPHLQGQVVGVLGQVPWKLTQVDAATVHNSLLGAGAVSGAVDGSQARPWLLGTQDQHGLLLYKFVLLRAQAMGTALAKHGGSHREHGSQRQLWWQQQQKQQRPAAGHGACRRRGQAPG